MNSMNKNGFSRIPAEFSDHLKFDSFDGQTFLIPGDHKLGDCRPLSDFMKMCNIGAGSYGIVYKAKEKITNNIYAIKKLKIDNDDFELMPQNILREIFNLKLLIHPNIVKLIDVAAEESFDSTYLVLEFCKYSLARVIDDDPRFLTRPLIKNIMRQLFTGLEFVHKHFICHRDINPSNILFTEDGTLKISDFGSSRKFAKGNLTPNVGTKWYRAPEILFGSVEYSSSVDIWSAGCVFAEMLVQKVLFRGDTDFDIIDLIINLLGSPTEKEWPEHTKLPVFQDYDVRQQRYNTFKPTFISESNTTVSLIRDMLVYNPSMRLSAKKCLEHKYFQEAPEACSFRVLVSILHASEAI